METISEPDNPNAFDLETVSSQEEMNFRQTGDIRDADFVARHYGDRTIVIDDTPSFATNDEMKDFTAMIDDDQLYFQLSDAT